MICKACKPCQTAKVRRQQLSAAFEQADKEDLPPPNIDSYGHTHGDTVVEIDLFTGEPSLWCLPYRKMISLIIRQRRKRVCGRIVHSVVNRYHGIKHITTGGIDPI